MTRIIGLSILVALMTGCISGNRVYTLKGEESAYNALGWNYPQPHENTGAVNTFLAFVKQLRSEEPHKAGDFLAGNSLKMVLKRHPCLKKGKIRVFDPNTDPSNTKTVLTVRCAKENFRVSARFYNDSGWKFDFTDNTKTDLKHLK